MVAFKRERSKMFGTGRVVGKETLDREAGMEILFWLVVAIIVLAVIYGSLMIGKRKETAGREAVKFDVAPGKKEHGIDLQARRKVYDDVT